MTEGFKPLYPAQIICYPAMCVLLAIYTDVGMALNLNRLIGSAPPVRV
jgi:hypothetical protein